MRPAPALAAMLGALALAGCLTASQPPIGAAAPRGLGAVALDYVCPPGETSELPGGLCVRSLWAPRETYEEPWLAVHPARPDVMALGVNAWHAEPRPALGPAGAGAELVRMAVFVTEDGGATWREAALPEPMFADPRAWPAHGSVDPALAFDAEGTLHVTQLNTGFSGPFWFDVQHVASRDLGRTWSEPMLLADDGDNDRNWLSVGPDGTLWAAWRNVLRERLPPSLTWSTDGGRTWAEPASLDGDCSNGDRPLPLDGGVLVSCTVFQGGEPSGIEVHHFALATGAWTRRSAVPTPPGWDPAGTLYALGDAAPDGTVALATRQMGAGAFLAVSRDGARTWAEPRLLTDLCACDGAQRLVAYWAAFDSWGGLHLLLRDGYLGTPDDPNEDNVRYANGGLSTWHVVLDVRSGATVQERTLLAPGAEWRRVPQSASPPIGRDDYYAPAFWADGGALAWTRDKGVDIAVLEPAGDARQPTRSYPSRS